MPKVINQYREHTRPDKPHHGDLYRHKDGDFYMLVNAGYVEEVSGRGVLMALVSLADGNRWVDAVPEDEFEVPSSFKYVANPEIIVRRSE